MQSELPKGDAALLAAIASGSPVPTTPEQAREVHRWGVWCNDPAGEGSWCTEKYSGGDRVYATQAEAQEDVSKTTARNRDDPAAVGYSWDARPYPSPTLDHQAIAKSLGATIVTDFDEQQRIRHGVGKRDPTPAQPPAPGEWKVEPVGKYDGFDVVGPGGCLTNILDRLKAEALAQRLNRADAMERALEEVSRIVSSALSDESGPSCDVVCAQVLVVAEAALRK